MLQRFRCHTCGIAGDGYDIIMAVEGGDLPSAKARVAEIAGMTFTQGTSTGDGIGGKSRFASRHTSERRKLIRERYGRQRRF